MKGFFRWISSVLTGSVVLVLVFVMLPYAMKYMSRIMPDESGAAIKASAVLATHLNNSARLETLQVSEEGVLNYEVKPAFLPTVAEITAKYNYAASFGLDLRNVKIQANGNHMTIIFPAFELIQDSITPTEIYRDDYWYPWIKDEKYEQLFETERLLRRDAYLTGEKQQLLLDSSIQAFEKTIATWLNDINGQMTFSYSQGIEE